MTAPEVFFVAIVLLFGISTMSRNATTAALVASWTTGQIAWLLTGDNLPLRVYIMADLAVIAVIYCKQPTQECGPYPTRLYQMACLWLELSWSDRAVLTLFIVGWSAQAFVSSEYHLWWALYCLTALQFIAAGAAGFYQMARERAVRRQSTETHTGLEFSWAGSRGD